MKILVVEDNESIRSEIEEILQLEGFEVVGAENGLEGLSVYHNDKPDLIISDIMMPKMDGYEMLKTLQSSYESFDTPFLFLTAKTETTDIRKGMSMGADDYLTKPFEIEDLLNAINAKLERSKKLKNRLKSLRDSIALHLPHELRTPLNAIAGFTSLLKDMEDSELTRENINEIANIIETSSNRLMKLVEKYILFAGLSLEWNQNGSRAITNNSIDYEKIINQKIILHSFNNGRAGDINFTCEASKTKIKETDFEILIDELIDNAFKFSEDGQKINISSKTANNFFELKVHNEGIGIKKEKLDQIGGLRQFNRNKMEQQGPGLGLAIVTHLTHLNNGKIQFDSEPGKYFEVTVSLPL